MFDLKTAFGFWRWDLEYFGAWSFRIVTYKDLRARVSFPSSLPNVHHDISEIFKGNSKKKRLMFGFENPFSVCPTSPRVNYLSIIYAELKSAI